MNASLEVSAKEQRLGIFKQRGTSQNLSLSDSRIGNEMSSINFLDVVRSVARPRGWVAGDARTVDQSVRQMSPIIASFGSFSVISSPNANSATRRRP